MVCFKAMLQLFIASSTGKRIAIAHTRRDVLPEVSGGVKENYTL
jgi:hypothetical protein